MVPLGNLGANMMSVTRGISAMLALGLTVTTGSALAQVTTTYGYDAQGQVRQVISSVQNTTYTYDAAGNRSAMTNAPPPAGLAARSTVISSKAAPTAKILQGAVLSPPPTPATARALPFPPPPSSPPPPSLPSAVSTPSSSRSN